MLEFGWKYCKDTLSWCLETLGEAIVIVRDDDQIKWNRDDWMNRVR